MATKPWRKNAWSFRAEVMCNPATMAFNPGLCPPPQSPPLSPPAGRHSSVPKSLIFQRLEDSKEEHALRFYANACQNYTHSKEKVKRQCNKSDQELLMENCHLYRTRLENAERLERVRGIEECHSGEQLWAMSLREHWTVEPRIGDLYSTPVCYMKEGFQKDIEQIGSPFKENLHHLLAGASDSKITKQMSTWMSYKRFLQKCEKMLAKVDVHTPDFLGLEVVGTKLSTKSATLIEQRNLLPDSESILSQAEDSKASDCVLDQPGLGPGAELNITKLFLHAHPGDHVSASVILHNTGSTSLYFEWRRQPQLSLCSVQHANSYITEALALAEGDRISKVPCFYIVPVAGILVPGESKDFYVEFCPKFPGSFIDSWVLGFSPQVSSTLQTLHLLGAAPPLEDENRTRQRELFQQSLEIRQRTRGLQEFFCEITEKATKLARSNFRKAPDFVSSQQFFDFIRCNIEFFNQTPLYYSPRVVSLFQELAVEISKKQQEIMLLDSVGTDESLDETLPIWDTSVSMLMSHLDTVVSSEEEWKTSMIPRASSLQLSAAIPAHPTAILHTAMYVTLVKVVSQIEEVMEKRDSRNESEELSDSKSVTTLAMNDESVRNPSELTLSNMNANVGRSAGKTFGGNPSNVNATEDGSVKGLGSSPAKQIFRNANASQGSSLGRGSPVKPVPTNLNMGPTNSVSRFGEGNPSKLGNASSRGDASKNTEGATPEQAANSEVAESVEMCEDKVRQLFQEGVVDQFRTEVEGAVTKLALAVQRKIEWYMAAGEDDSASWLSLWFMRLSHALAG